MKFPPTPLTNEEKLDYDKLFAMTIGMGCSCELSKLNAQQTVAIRNLAEKGYVILTKKKFTFVIPAKISN